MPVQYNLAASAQLSNSENPNAFAKLQYYLVENEAKYFADWQTYNQLFGTLNWKPNMGPTMTGVRPTRTPIGQTSFYPLEVKAGVPNKNVYSIVENSESCTLKWQDFDSMQIPFLPNFQDFKPRITDLHTEIVRQMAYSNDFFIRTAALERAPYLYIAGNNDGSGASLVDAPYQTATALTSTNALKTTAWWQAQIAKVTTNLSLAVLDNLANVVRDDIGAVPFEGVKNTPKENELIKGKYVWIGSLESFQYLKWDPNFQQFRNVNTEYSTAGFSGSIFDQFTFRAERTPIRFLADGTNPAPEIQNQNTGDAVPNPQYVNAPFELAFICGADAMKTIKVGPPPKPFSSKDMTQAKFFAMNWNGELNLTDQVLITYPDGTVDLNSRGRFVKFIGSVSYGIIACRPQSFVPVLYRRKRAGVV